MKRLSLICFLFLLLISASAADAQTFDSLYADTLIAVPASIIAPRNALGAPNNAQAAIVSVNDEFYIGFTLDSRLVVMDSNANVRVTWNNEAPGDTVAGFLTFVQFDYRGIELKRSQTPIVIDKPGVQTVQVPGSGYNVLLFTLTHTDLNPGSHSFYIDGLTLVQRVTAGVNDAHRLAQYISSYPNPFRSSEGTNVHLQIAQAGKASLEIRDMLGRLVGDEQLGNVEPGAQDIPVHNLQPGAYFVRLFIDGVPQGAPVKLSAE